MSRKPLESTKSVIAPQLNPMDCPFREFRDNELQTESWGLSTAAFKTYLYTQSIKISSKNDPRAGIATASPKVAALSSGLWVDEQTQPLPRSVRQYLHGWIRAEDLAMDRWGAELTIFDEIDSGKMSIADMQLCHAQVLFRSSFCRQVLSLCFVLERLEFTVEHQWELFTCVFAPEGWRGKYHIYSPGVKAGGGLQHKPMLSKNENEINMQALSALTHDSIKELVPLLGPRSLFLRSWKMWKSDFTASFTDISSIDNISLSDIVVQDLNAEEKIETSNVSVAEQLETSSLDTTSTTQEHNTSTTHCFYVIENNLEEDFNACYPQEKNNFYLNFPSVKKTLIELLKRKKPKDVYSNDVIHLADGCYLVRLYYLGAWRCVWVNDQVPVDTSGAPLLPFSPLLTHPPAKPGSNRIPPAVTAGVIYLWPLLLTKALLKLAAPDMHSDEDTEDVEDEPMWDFDILQALTGSMNIRYLIPKRAEDLWTRIISEVPLFVWDDVDDSSTIKTKSVKKPTAKELAAVVKRPGALTYAIIKDTKDYPPYHLPGITPGHEMSLIITMARDVPIKKPLPEPEVALWKYYRWVDWARAHGLYAAYDCPRDKFIKVNGLLKSSYAPHLLDVQSTESITMGFIEEHVKSNTGKDDDDDAPKKKKKENTRSLMHQTLAVNQQARAELREWIQFEMFFTLMKCLHVVYYPSLFNMVAAGSIPPVRTTKSGPVKMTDVVAPTSGPLYLQLDGPDENILRISFATLHPRILMNSGSPVDEFIEPGHLVLEKFEWFKDTESPIMKAFLTTRRYNSVEISFKPGRHFFRIWTHYRVNWHLAIISESTLLLNTRDVVQGAAVRECPWAARFLSNLGTAFTNWIKVSRIGPTPIATDREFFRSYLPDLTWNDATVGYDRHLLHWMFRQALQSLLSRTMNQTEFKAASYILRKYFCDPDFGFSPKPKPPRSLREIANLDVCDCLMPEVEEIECMEEQVPEVPGDQDAEPGEQTYEEKPIVAPEVMAQLLKAPEPPVVSQLCELATSEIYCAVLKEEREKMIRKHEAAIVIQSYWRGTWVRKILAANIVFSPEVTKSIMERAFGTQEALSSLMNEFFLMYPGTIYSYSVASALSGVYGLQQHNGVTVVTSKCKWIPHFQGVFYCHTHVKVHFDVQSSISHSTVKVYNNDTGKDLPQVYNSHITFDFAPNFHGYTVLGHGTLAQVANIGYDAPWQLTIMSSLSNAFHICDNEEPCKEQSLPSSTKLHIDEIFLPNRRNILGGIQISVTKYETVSFRAAASSSDLEMVATLRSTVSNGITEELGTCSGRGELYWPFIRLEPMYAKRSQYSLSNKDAASSRSLSKPSATTRKGIPHGKNRSFSKMRFNVTEPRVYSIEVTCPQGWPLTLDQWIRVDEVRNSVPSEVQTLQVPKGGKSAMKEKDKGKSGSAKEKADKASLVMVPQPIPGDACVELECALAVGGGAEAKRDDERDLEFRATRKLWAASEPNRNQKGAQFRKEFRAEFLVVPPPPLGPTLSVTESMPSASTNFSEGLFEEIGAEEAQPEEIPRPTPASETELVEMSVEVEEETLYLLMPDALRDKFKSLYFLPFCTKEKTEEESILITPGMAEAAKQDRNARILASLERMRELQLFNEEHVIGRQRYRTKLLEKLFVDTTIKPEILEVMDLKEEAIVQEVNLRNLSATKKKIDSKKK